MSAIRRPRIAPETIDSETEFVPFHLEAEQCCIASILLDSSIASDVFDIVRPEDFFRESHTSIIRAMHALYRRGSPIDAVTLHEELSKTNSYEQVGGNDYLEEIITRVPHAANGKYYAGIVRDWALRRELYYLARKLATDIRNNVRNGADQLDFFAKAVNSIGAADGDDDDLTSHPLPTAMADAAFRGLAGELVRRIKPETEASAEAVLAQFLTAFGNVVGPRPRFLVGTTVHRCNLFMCLAGPTGIARKGTAWDVARWILEKCDPIWGQNPTPSGMTSGEGLVRILKEAEGEGVMFVETEFAKVLTNMNRDNNSLSATLHSSGTPDIATSQRKTSPSP